MEGKGDGNSTREEDEKPVGLTPQVLDYYKRFGRHRDLEQYFSLSTVQGEVRDPVFWRSIKSQVDSDSGKSSAEVCRISINCTVADLSSSSQDGSTSDVPEPYSPPIISEDAPPAPLLSPLLEDDREVKSDLDTSHKSMDLNLDSSLAKPHSPTSSINSQRKLEWDSLADVGYANENEIRPSASSLSTLERLALHQQFSLSDELKNNDISGRPTAHSTPHEAENAQSKGNKNGRKGLLKQATKISQRDVDVMEINVDRDRNVLPANISFNLTKHISFNVDPETGAASVCNNKTTPKTDYLQKCTSVTMDAAVGSSELLNKEIQTTLPRPDSEQKQENHPKITPNIHSRYIATVPVLLNLDLLKRSRYRGLKYYRNKVKKKKKSAKLQQITKKKVAEQLEKSIPISEVTLGCSQLSEADSFEYMPAHVYHQNTARSNRNRDHVTETSNKTSSSASSGGYTTLSSKHSENSFTKDLEKSIAVLNKLVQLRHQDANLKKKLVKEVVHKLIKTNYRDDESATEFLSGLSFNSKILGLGIESSSYHNTTTSTSDGNDGDNKNNTRPKKSILRSLNSAKPVNPPVQSEHVVGETFAQVHSPPHVVENLLMDNNSTDSSKTGSDKKSVCRKLNSEEHITKTSSEQLYELYMKALLKEEKYKEHLKNKQEFSRNKLIQKKTVEEAPSLKTSSLKDLMKVLTKNNGCNRGGDGDIPPDAVHSNPEIDRNGIARKLRSHSVFTISSGNSERNIDNKSSMKKQQNILTASEPIKKPTDILTRQTNHLKFNTLPITNKMSHYCCCPHHYTKKSDIDDVLHANEDLSKGGRKISEMYLNKSKDSSSKEKHVNKMLATNATDILATDLANCNKFVCFCNADGNIIDDIPDNFLIYKCCKLPQVAISGSISKDLSNVQCSSKDFHMESNRNYNRTERKQEDIFTDNQILHTVPPVCKFINSKMTVLKDNKSQSTESNSSDIVKSLKIRSSKDYSSSQRGDVRVHCLPQSSRSNINMPRRFSDTLSEIPKSTLCVDTYMQTSVSIDPKISEPTLTDINILHGNNEGIVTKPESTNKNNKASHPTIPMYNCSNCDKGGVSTIDRNDKPFVVQNHHQSKKYNNEALSKGQSETYVDALFNSEDSSAKSRISSIRSDNNGNTKTFLNGEKTKDSNLCAVNTASEGVNTECITQRDMDTSVTGLSKEASHKNNHSSVKSSTRRDILIETELPRLHIDEKKSSSHSSKENSSNNSAVSTYGTPRNEQSTLKQQRNLKSPDSSRSANRIKGQDPKHDVISNFSESINKIHEESIIRGKKNISDIDLKSKSFKIKKTLQHNSTEENSSSSTMSKEILLESIKDIIKRYAKEDKPVTIDKKTSRQKYYQEIISKLNYLLRTERNTEADEINSVKSLKCDEEISRKPAASKDHATDVDNKKTVDKSTQHHNISSEQNFVSHHSRTMFLSEDSSDLLPSSVMRENSADSLRYHIVKKIRKECYKFHDKHCQCASNFEMLNSRYDASSSTSISRHKGDEMHNTHGRCSHRCRSKSSKCSHNKVNKKSIAYNLIIQPSDSVIQNENVPERDKPILKDIVVKVPSRRTIMFQKTSQKDNSQHEPNTDIGECSKSEQSKLKKNCARREKQFKESETDRSGKQSLPDSDIEATVNSEARKFKFLTLREYLERNRPDFVSNSSERQGCLKVIHESRVRQQRAQRTLLSLQAERQDDVTPGTVTKLEDLARRLGDELRTRRPNAKFLSEHEMKRHSRKIYTSLPEVLQKKEKHKNDQIKKTNMIIRSLFNKNLQKKVLRGSVNVSHYSPVIKI